MAEMDNLQPLAMCIQKLRFNHPKRFFQYFPD
jgi:hypothetical protein